MKLRIVSDIHAESGKAEAITIGNDGEDVVVCAGDVTNDPISSIVWLESHLPKKPIVFVPGNHEYYGALCVAEADADMREAASKNIHFLQNSSVVIDGVRFLGSTLWSKFNLFAQSSDLVQKRIPMTVSIADAERWVNDFRYVHSHYDRLMSAQDARLWALTACKFLEKELATKGKWRATVVVTHFAPAAGSVAAEFYSDSITPYFVNDLTELVQQADIWIHGHTHCAFDYYVGKCRVVCNAGGYRREPTGFKPNLIVEV